MPSFAVVHHSQSRRHEIDTDLVKRAGKIVVDQKSACMVGRDIRSSIFSLLLTSLCCQAEAGELISASCTKSDLVEIGELLDIKGKSWTPRAGIVQDIRQSGNITIFKSVGVGVQDVAIACAVVDRALKDGIGRRIEDYDEEL